MSTLTFTDILKQYRRLGRKVPANLLPQTAKPETRKTPLLGSGNVLAITVRLDIRTVSEANARGKGETRARMVRKKLQRQAARSALANLRADSQLLLHFGIVVTLTRFAPGELDEFDNLRVALKAVVDGVADAYGTDDRDPRIEWRCGPQVKSKAYAVEIRIERKP